MRKISLRANAKINLSLDVLGKREDGYHELRMIMQSIDLYDTVTLSLNEDHQIRLSMTGIPVDEGKDNLAYRAAEIFCHEYNVSQGVDIHIEKQIPLGSGMAGGSADAAAVFVGCNHLFGKNVPVEDLKKLGLRIGADVPFAITGGTALAEGVGEKLTNLPFLPIDILIIKPNRSMSTQKVFQKLNLHAMGDRPNIPDMIECMKKGDVGSFAVRMRNVLESVTLKEIPQIIQIKKNLKRLGAIGVLMTGSGSAVFGIFEDGRQREYAFEKLQLQPDLQVYRASTVRKGVEFQ